MELKMMPYSIPEAVVFNYDELKAELMEKIDKYTHMVYTDDQISAAKADRAALNRLKKALNDERIKREKEYMEPFAAFKGQIAEIICIIDKPCAVIDKQIKEFEESKKAEKLEKIKGYWQEVLEADKIPAGITFNHFFNEKWLNASVKMKAIQDEFNAKLQQIENDLAVIEKLPAYAFEAKQAYISTLDLARAVSEAHRLSEMAERKASYEAEQAKRREEAAARQHAQAEAAKQAAPVQGISTDLPTEPKRELRKWIGFQAYLTVDDARALGQYFKANGIQYKAI